VADILAWVEVIDRDGQIGRIDATRLDLGYRSCHLPVEGGVIVEAGFTLVRRPEREVLEKVKEILAQRQRRMPFGWKNAGSVFKNPPGDHAGRIVEALGFKGRTVGRATVSDQHANVIVNAGGATARDIITLMDEIARAAREQLGVTLESEVIVVGEG
jgi:UDP-N-acetylmuramate dehydrogenase